MLRLHKWYTAAEAVAAFAGGERAPEVSCGGQFVVLPSVALCFITTAHARRWLIHRGQIGTGHLYQGRYKSFAIQDGPHLSTVCRYVERNPVRAGTAKRSRDWPWGSAGQDDLPAELRLPLERHPHLARPDWRAWVDRPQTAAEEAALLRCIREGRPYGEDKWLKRMEKTLAWREPLKRGRPRKAASRPGK